MMKPNNLPQSRRRRAALLAGLSLLSAVAQATDPVVVQFSVKDGKVVGGSQVIRLTRGDLVRLVVRSDKPDELHLHGYDLHAKVGASTPATVEFVAGLTGRFSVEFHHSGIELGVLEIYPK